MEENREAKRFRLSVLLWLSHNERGIITSIDIIDDSTGLTIFHRDEKTPTPGILMVYLNRSSVM